MDVTFELKPKNMRKINQVESREDCTFQRKKVKSALVDILVYPDRYQKNNIKRVAYQQNTTIEDAMSKAKL